MPIHEYQCPKCLIQIERIHSNEFVEFVLCPKCKIPMEQQLSSPGLLVIK